MVENPKFIQTFAHFKIIRSSLTTYIRSKRTRLDQLLLWPYFLEMQPTRSPRHLLTFSLKLIPISDRLDMQMRAYIGWIKNVQ